MLTVEQHIWEHALATPNKLAIISGKQRVTYAVLQSRIVAAKELLEKIDLDKIQSRDFVTGTAGLIVVLLNIFEKELDEEYLKKAELLTE